MSEPQPLLPNGYCPLETQVAGHSFEVANAASVGMIKDISSGCILKPLGKSDCAKRELAFYESVQQSSSCSESKNSQLLLQLRPYIPVFHDKLRLRVNQTEHAFVKLENLVEHMSKPCVLDIKIGKQTWDPLATPEKRYLEDQKYANCKEQLGLCIPGFQVYACASNKLLRFGKDYGKQLHAAQLRDTLALFFNVTPASHGERCHTAAITQMLQEVLRQLHAIRDWFKQQTLLHFYASSILIVYDCAQLERAIKRTTAGIQRTDDSVGDSPKLADWIKVRMIDFAHVFPAEHDALDENYLFGVQNLIVLIEDLLKS